MLVTPIQNSIAFNAKFVMLQELKPKTQRFQSSELTKKEAQLSRGLEHRTPLDKGYKLVLSSIDWCKNQYMFKLLQNNKKVAKGEFKFEGGPKNPIKNITEDELHEVYKDLKTKADNTYRPSFKYRVKDEDGLYSGDIYFFRNTY